MPPLKIGYSMPSATHGYMARAIYWAETGMADWKAKDPSLEFLFVTADNVTKQANDIEDLIQQDIDALIVFPFDASVTSVVEKAYEAGIYTVVMDRGTSKPVYESTSRMTTRVTPRAWNGCRSGWATKAMSSSSKHPASALRFASIPSRRNNNTGINILDSQPGDWNMQGFLRDGELPVSMTRLTPSIRRRRHDAWRCRPTRIGRSDIDSSSAAAPNRRHQDDLGQQRPVSQS